MSELAATLWQLVEAIEDDHIDQQQAQQILAILAEPGEQRTALLNAIATADLLQGSLGATAATERSHILLTRLQAEANTLSSRHRRLSKTLMDRRHHRHHRPWWRMAVATAAVLALAILTVIYALGRDQQWPHSTAWKLNGSSMSGIYSPTHNQQLHQGEVSMDLAAHSRIDFGVPVPLLAQGWAALTVKPGGAGFTMATPQGTVTVRGTEYDLAVGPTVTLLRVDQGQVELDDPSAGLLQVNTGAAAWLHAKRKTQPTLWFDLRGTLQQRRGAANASAPIAETLTATGLDLRQGDALTWSLGTDDLRQHGCSKGFELSLALALRQELTADERLQLGEMTLIDANGQRWNNTITTRLKKSVQPGLHLVRCGLDATTTLWATLDAMEPTQSTLPSWTRPLQAITLRLTASASADLYLEALLLSPPENEALP